MKPMMYFVLGFFLLVGSLWRSAAADRFVSLDGGHVPPFTSWSDAATNIQAAIDAASGGDIVWVTNGIYATGGKVMAGDLTNRVALDKALTVQSMNGPFVTKIQGNGAFNGTTSVRCAWLTNGATLIGFTLTGGGTRQSGDSVTLRSGGGAWCVSSTATLANCVIITNACFTSGSGAYQGTLRNCLIRGNLLGGAFMANLVNCTVTSNASWGVFGGRLTNSIVAYNSSDVGGATATYSCTLSFLTGAGNIVGSPRLLPDGIHLANDSPCRAAGTNVASGADIDGEGWSSPPDMGCDQWQSAPLIVGPLKVQLINNPAGFNISVTVAGQEPLDCRWFRDGMLLENDGHYQNVQTTNLVAKGLYAFDPGNYQVVVSNAFGMATGAVQIVAHYVDAAGASPISPYATWATAATNIQDAIDVALPGEFVVVSNGIYANGGRVMAGDLTNRIALNKAIPVLSVNGPGVTIIQGAWDPNTTNGPLAVRCAWLTNGAILSGFTLQGGATRDSGDTFILQSGGGVWSPSANATVINCLVISNCARQYGGGAYSGTFDNCHIANNATLPLNAGAGGGVAYSTVNNCLIIGNAAGTGGGAHNAYLYNCAVIQNSAASGGGCYETWLVNCTVVRNSSSFGIGSGLYSTKPAVNCIIWNNRNGGNSANYNSGAKLTNCCTYPIPTFFGANNISTDPQLLADEIHLSSASPCRGAGSSLSATGTDIDGQAWTNPPAIGCDEWYPEPLAVVQPIPRPAPGNGQVNLVATFAGQEPMQFFWSKNGAPLTDDDHYTNSQTTSLLIHNFDLSDAGAYQVVASNAMGVATSQVAQVTVRCADPASATPAAPYTNWASAAMTLQEAVDAALPNDVVLATNGIYTSGGRAEAGDLTNRVVINKPLLVLSMNGPNQTAIQGEWDPVLTNGPAAARCAWLADGAALSGFTLRDGATTTNKGTFVNGYGLYDSYGGGALCSSTNATLHNSIVSMCRSESSGGGVFSGFLMDCTVSSNACTATTGFGGGGTVSSLLVNCIVTKNSATKRAGGVNGGVLYNSAITENTSGTGPGGVYGARLFNSTVTGNSAALQGGGIASCVTSNCIVYFNTAPIDANIGYSFSYFTCSTPLPGGVGNISSDPQLTDGWHLSVNSPCRGMGATSAATGTDLDGDLWASPPSIGCDEVDEAAMVGPLSVNLSAAYPEVAAYGSLPLFGKINGRASSVTWSFGDGVIETNLSTITFYTWTNPGDYLVTFTAYNSDNIAGVSDSITVHVVPLEPPQMLATGLIGTNFSLTFPGQAGVTYVLEMATNLVTPINWQNLQTLISTGGVIQVTDSKATNAMRFYRTRTQ